MESALDGLDEQTKSVIVEVIERRDPQLITALASHNKQTIEERRAVASILFNEFSMNLDTNFEPTKRGRDIDAAMGEFLLQWPIESTEQG